MAVAVAGSDHFGKGESAIAARLPLMVRPSAPRFLNFGDRFELPIVLEARPTPLTVDLAARTHNLDLTQGAGRKVTVPANDRVEVRLPAAAVKAGTARSSSRRRRQVDRRRRRRAPRLDPHHHQGLRHLRPGRRRRHRATRPPPARRRPQLRRPQADDLLHHHRRAADAVLYLARYPFECSEQLASRMLTIAALGRALRLQGRRHALAGRAARLRQRHRAPRPPAEPRRRLVLLAPRRAGLALPHRARRPRLERRRSKGFAVPATLDRAQDYLKDIESRFEPSYGPEVRRPIVAYALHVRHRLGVRDLTRARSL